MNNHSYDQQLNSVHILLEYVEIVIHYTPFVQSHTERSNCQMQFS